MKDPAAILLAHEWAATVALAGICDQASTGPSLGTQHVRSDLTTVCCGSIACSVGDNCDLSLLKNVWRATTRPERAPTSDETHLVADQRFVFVWQTYSTNAIVKFEGRLKLQDRKVVHHSRRTVMVRDDVYDSTLLRIVR